MRPLLAILILSLGAAGLAAQDERNHLSKEGKYRVTFPIKPTLSTTTSDNLQLHMAAAEQGGGAMVVIYSDLPGETVKAAKPGELLAGAEKGLVDNFKAKVTSSKDITFGTSKFPGREIMGEKDTVQMHIKLVLAGDRLYQFFVIGSKEYVKSKDAEKFFESFEISK
jgi:hypothetical protein